MTPAIDTIAEPRYPLAKSAFGFDVRVRNQTNGRERTYCDGSFAIGWAAAVADVLDQALLGLLQVAPRPGDRLTLDIECVATGRIGRFAIESYRAHARWQGVAST